MSDITRLLAAIEAGDSQAADQLLPLVYDELRKLAAARMAGERAGHTLQATALVHEAYLRLVDPERQQQWDSRAHFFAAAAEAMRRILVDSARRRRARKRDADAVGDGLRPAALLETADGKQLDLLALDEALKELEQRHPKNAEVVKLRYFVGCTLEETAELLGISRATAERKWSFARAWLYRRLAPDEPTH